MIQLVILAAVLAGAAVLAPRPVPASVKSVALPVVGVAVLLPVA